MASKKIRHFECPVIHEQVEIYLRDKRRLITQTEKHCFVQCNQEDCQYVKDNQTPCPLDVSMFAEEILKKQEEAERRHKGA